MAAARPLNVGILAMDVYTPPAMVDMSDLEVLDGVSGKYVKGLEQVSLSFPAQCEDAVSMALTCVHSLLDKYALDPRRIGRLECGSESGPDRSKSIKSYLMQLIGAAGAHDLEGVDCVHGCYGGTAAFLNSVNWVESSCWDGRFALVVMTDVAVYAPGSSARATGGAGAVAMLVGPNAPLVLDPAWRATYSENSQEFCKPAALPTQVPTFDGPATVYQFLKAVDCCYVYLHRRLMKLQMRVQELKAQGVQVPQLPYHLGQGLLPLIDFFISHAPYSRLVRKAFSRLMLQDALRSQDGDSMLGEAGVPARWRVCEPDALPGHGYDDKALERALLKCSEDAFNAKVAPGTYVQQRMGNTYSACVYCGLAGLWEAHGAQLAGRRIMLFSFGSGTMATLFSLVGRHVPDPAMEGFTLQRVADKLQLRAALDARARVPPAVYNQNLRQVVDRYGMVPQRPLQHSYFAPNSMVWLLTSVDERHVRTYARVHIPEPKGSSEEVPSSGGTVNSNSMQGVSSP